VITAKSSSRTQNHKAWAQRVVTALYLEHHNWRKVASELDPFLSVSPAAWWHVFQGRSITKAKINALRGYYGLPLLHRKGYWRPCLPDPGDERREALLAKFVQLIKEVEERG